AVEYGVATPGADRDRAIVDDRAVVLNADSEAGGPRPDDPRIDDGTGIADADSGAAVPDGHRAGVGDRVQVGGASADDPGSDGNAQGDEHQGEGTAQDHPRYRIRVDAQRVPPITFGCAQTYQISRTPPVPEKARALAAKSPSNWPYSRTMRPSSSSKPAPTIS